MATLPARLQAGLLAILALYIPAMAFVDRAQWKMSLGELLGKAKRLPVLWRFPAADPIAGVLLWLPFMLLTWIDSLLPARAVHAYAPWQLWQKAALAMMALVAVFLALAAIRLRRWQRQAEALQLSRGVLFDSIRRIARKAKLFGGARPRIYVISEVSQARLCAYFGSTVLIPRQLLDSMSRREVDALAARQLCRQSRQYYSPPSWALLACDLAAVCLVGWLKISLATCWIVLPALLAVQFAALAIYLPRALADADWRAVELTGDAETFLSATAGLARFSGGSLPEQALRQIAARSGLSPERIPALLGGRIAPAEDRYPTSGPYVITGLP